MESSSEEVVLLQETIDNQMMEVEEDAALLGAASPTECTYSKGYVGRQMVYTCQTCQSQPNVQPGGFCYGCMMNCHEGHEIVELFTRRNFKCDCGNSKFIGNPCKLLMEKDALNTDNIYDANFSGLPSGETLQCTICEAWILKPDEFPARDDFDFDITCQVCTYRLSFLGYYRECLHYHVPVGDDDIADPQLLELHKTRQADCELLKRVVPGLTKLNGVLAWEPNFRKILCSCVDCKQLYSAEAVPFIDDPSDFLDTYFDVGFAAHDTSVKDIEEKFETKVESMNRYAQGELALGIGSLKKGLEKMLQTSSKTDKLITVEDVKDMFKKLNKKKKN